MKMQFGIRDAMLVVSLIAMLIVWWMDRRRQQQTIERQAELLEVQADLIRDHETDIAKWKKQVEQYQNHATRSFFDVGAPSMEVR